MSFKIVSKMTQVYYEFTKTEIIEKPAKLHILHAKSDVCNSPKKDSLNPSFALKVLVVQFEDRFL